MKKRICFMAMAAMVAGMALRAAELQITPQSPWRAVKEGSGKTGYALQYSGKGWANLGISAAVKPETHYRLTWMMKSTVEDKTGSMQLGLDAGGNHNYSYALSSGWSAYTAYFFSGKADTVKLRLYTNPGEPREINVKDIQLTAVTPEMLASNLLSGGDFENCSGLPVDWGKSYGTPSLMAKISENQDFLSGKQSMEMEIDMAGADKGNGGITSIYLPVIPGRKFEFTFWAKADAETTISASIDCWSPVKHTGKHFYRSERFKVTTEWKSFTVTLPISTDIAAYPDLQNQLTRLSLSWNKTVPAKVLIDGATFRQVE